MATIAKDVLSKWGFSATGGYESYTHHVLDDDALHGLLNRECADFQEILGQDTWSFQDSSYITYNNGHYYYGHDVGDFLLTGEMVKERGGWW